MSNSRWPAYLVVALGLLAAVGCGPKNGPIGLTLAQPPTEIERVVISPDTSNAGFTVTVNGRITFEKLSVIDDAGNLVNRTATTQPLRGVDVEAHDTSGALISTQVATDDNGNFTFTMLPLKAFTINVISSTTKTGGRVNLEVRSPLSPSPLYSIVIGKDAAGTPFDAATPLSTLNVAIDPLPSLAAPATGSFRPGAVANILDAAFVASEAHRVATGQTLPLVTFFWSPLVSDGSFFAAPNAIQLVGGDSDTDDTDEFDDSVIQHEFGHFLVFTIGRDYSLGGSHPFNGILYPQCSYSEGFADAYTCLVRKVPRYFDGQAWTSANVRGFGFQIESTGTQNFSTGRESENTVAMIFWDLFDGPEGRTSVDGDGASLLLVNLFNALKNLRNTVAATVIDDFMQSLIDIGAVSRSTIDTLLISPENLGFAHAGSDQFPQTIARNSTINDTVATRTAPPLGGPTADDEVNRLYKFDLAAATANVSMSATLVGVAGTDATGTNADLFLLDAKQNLVARSNDQDALEQITVPSLAAGRYYIYVTGRPNPFANGDRQTNASEQIFPIIVGLQ